MGCGSSSPKEVPKAPVEAPNTEPAEELVPESAPIVLSERTTGFMNKQGKQVKSWKRRYFCYY